MGQKVILLSEARVGDTVFIVPETSPSFHFTITHSEERDDGRWLYGAHAGYWLEPGWQSFKVQVERGDAWWR